MQDPAVGYAYWMHPDGVSKVVYPLGVFSEIDTLVSDGYRRIPHGGVETGGLLFGKYSEGTVQVEAFREIACQHAFGPSFVLSETDLAALKEQLNAAATDNDLAGLTPVGWFIGHTRSPLELNDREAAWFNDLFPKAGSLTVLIKPERFQPTRFAFLQRAPSGEMPRQSPAPAVILPLSGSSSIGSQAPAPSISAPRARQRPAIREREANESERPAQRPQREPEAVAPVRSTPPASPPPDQPARVREPVTPVTPFEPPSIAAAPPLRPAVNERNDSSSAEITKTSLTYPYASLARGRTRTEPRGVAGFGLRSAGVLLLAAILGCIAGYWAYLQLPSPVIPVSVREQPDGLVVEWPSNQTSSVDYAALQVNDGQWITLSAQQKDAGRAVISVPPGDLKIDLVAKHWLRDSRGIVRYIRTQRR